MNNARAPNGSKENKTTSEMSNNKNNHSNHNDIRRFAGMADTHTHTHTHTIDTTAISLNGFLFRYPPMDLLGD